MSTLVMGTLTLGVSAQELPNLANDITVCRQGALPFYVSCEDSVGAEEFYYPSGSIRAKGICLEGRKSGKWITYHENGKVQSVGEIEDGLLTGPWVFYYESGQKRAEGTFTAGQFELGCAGSENYAKATVKTGEWTFWNDNGSLHLICHFSLNAQQEEELSGTYSEWHANGKKRCEGVYKKGMKTGTWTYWYPNGLKQREEHYTYQDCGLYDYTWYECPSGTWKYWDERGVLTKTETYQNGVLKK